MESFSTSDWTKLLPDYLSSTDKKRLTDALLQFRNKNLSIDYSNFYSTNKFDYFLQGDVVEEIRIPVWNQEKTEFSSGYTTALILSNTCDISKDNKRLFNKKQCLCSPILKLDEYSSDLLAQGFTKPQIEGFLKEIKAQLVSNLLFLPFPTDTSNGYIALLDQVFWFPTDELNRYLEKDESGNVDTGKILTLNHFGYYLFILKLSHHLCRLPEEEDRSSLSHNN